jgi:NAD(P)-dependent dehydrogenase (short-subunit alcohol dehydrogenase family)
MASVREHDSDVYEEVFAINVKGTLNCMSAELKHMRTSHGDIGGGSIVNAASITGLVGKPNASIYCASKHAVVGITKAAAREEGERGIRVNAVAP